MADQADNSTEISTENSTDTNASAVGSEAAAAAAVQNHTVMSNTCLVPGGVPIVIQNVSSWEETVCLLGFYCK